MTNPSLIAGKLSPYLARLLLIRHLKIGGESTLDGAALLSTITDDWVVARELWRQYERLGDHLASRLAAIFEDALSLGGFDKGTIFASLIQILANPAPSDWMSGDQTDVTELASAFLHRWTQTANTTAETVVVESVFRKLLSAVMEVGGELDGSPRDDIKSISQKISQLVPDIPTILDTADRLASSAEQRSTDPEAQKNELNHRHSVLRTLDYMELFGVDVSNEVRRHSLSVAYVSLTLTSQGGASPNFDPVPADGLLDKLLESRGRLLIRGDAGSGKSTFFRWAALQAAGMEPSRRNPTSRTEAPELVAESSASLLAAEPRLTWRNRIPFLLRLRDCKNGRLPPPRNFGKVLASAFGHSPSSWVQSIIKLGRGLILLDGLDEVPGRFRDRVKTDLYRLIDAFPDNAFIVSTRPEAVPQDWLGEKSFREARVNPMSEHDKARFIDRWHDAIGRELARRSLPAEDLESLARELKEKLPDNPPIARLASNPLLCAMICALHRDRNRKLPESQIDLCEALSHMLLHRRENEGGLDLADFPECYRLLSYDQKRALVQDVAHYMVRNGESAIDLPIAQERFANSLSQFPDHRPEDAAVVCQTLVERSGMLREARPGVIDFIHNTFKEYLAAERFAQESDAGALAERADDPAWQPVILFAAATRRPGFASTLVERILRPPVPSVAKRQHKAELRKHLRTRRLFALRCKSMALYLEPRVTEEIQQYVAEMFPPESMQDCEALATAGDAAVPYLRFKPGLTASQAAACVRTLRLIATNMARRALDGYLNDTRRRVAFELAQAVDPLKMAWVREAVKKGAPLPPAIASQIGDLSAIASLEGIRVLNLSGTQVKDLRPIRTLTSIETLIISHTPVESIAPLSKLVGLRVLDISDTPVTDLRPIRNLASILELNISGTDIISVEPLRRVRNLRHLDAENTKIRDVGPLGRLEKLEALHLSGTRVEEVSPLARLRRLQHLCLSRSPITNIGPIARLRALSDLRLGTTPVRDISALAELSNLKLLVLSRTLVEDLSPLSRLTKLSALDSRHTNTPIPAMHVGNLKIIGGTPISESTKPKLTPLVRERADIAVITIIPEEYAAVRQYLLSPRPVRATAARPNTYAWEVGTIESQNGESYKIVLANAGRAGNVSGALCTLMTVQRFSPRYVLVVGIAGGLEREGLKKGDVVAATNIWHYEYGTIDDQYKPRPDYNHQTDDSLVRAATLLEARSTDWASTVRQAPPVAGPPPRLIPGPIASGEKVIDNPSHELFAKARALWPRLQAIEMEGAGAAAAAKLLSENGCNIGLLMLRGISDMPSDYSPGAPTGTQSNERGAWKKYASATAAACAIGLIRTSWPVAPRKFRRGTAKE